MKQKKWRYTAWDDATFTVFEDKGGNLHSDAKIAEDIRTEEDAKLIATAPELLELCELVYKSFGGGCVITFSETDMERFEQVIKKAIE